MLVEEQLIPVVFADYLEKLMAQRGWTQADVARHTWGTYTDARGYLVPKNRDMISDYLKGKTIPSRETLELLSVVFGEELSEIMWVQPPASTAPKVPPFHIGDRTRVYPGRSYDRSMRLLADTKKKKYLSSKKKWVKGTPIPLEEARQKYANKPLGPRHPSYVTPPETSSRLSVLPRAPVCAPGVTAVLPDLEITLDAAAGEQDHTFITIKGILPIKDAMSLVEAVTSGEPVPEVDILPERPKIR